MNRYGSSELRFRLTLLLVFLLFGVVAFIGLSVLGHSCDTSQYGTCPAEESRAVLMEPGRVL